MRCPACKERVIDFGEWGKGLNAFLEVDCPSCGAHLRPSRRIAVVFVLLLVLMVPCLVGIPLGLTALGIRESAAKLVFVCLMIPLVVGTAWWEWRTGFYAVRDGMQQEEASARPLNAGASGPGAVRFLFVAGIGAGLIAFWIMTFGRDLLLTFDKQTTEGRITRIHQPPPGAVREADYQVWYEFKSESGFVYSGEDELPPAAPPREDRGILVVYSRRDPSVSRIASQLSSTPVAGVLLGAVLLLWSVVQLVRTRRRSASRAEQTA